MNMHDMPEDDDAKGGDIPQGDIDVGDIATYLGVTLPGVLQHMIILSTDDKGRRGSDDDVSGILKYRRYDDFTCSWPCAMGITYGHCSREYKLELLEYLIQNLPDTDGSHEYYDDDDCGDVGPPIAVHYIQYFYVAMVNAIMADLTGNLTPIPRISRETVDKAIELVTDAKASDVQCTYCQCPLNRETVVVSYGKMFCSALCEKAAQLNSVVLNRPPAARKSLDINKLLDNPN